MGMVTPTDTRRTIMRIMSRKTFANELLRKSFLSLFLRGLGFIVYYLFWWYCINNRGYDEWGNFIFLYTVLQVQLLLANFSSDNYLVSIVSSSDNFDNERAKIYSFVLVNSLIVSIVLVILDFTFSYIGGLWLIMIIASLAINHIKVLAGSFRAQRRIAFYSIMESLGRFFPALILIVLADQVFQIQVQLIQALAVGLILVFLLTIPQAPAITRIISNVRNWFNVIKKSIDFMVLNAANQLFLLITILVGQYFLSAEGLGVFDSLNKILGIGVLSIFAVNSIGGPRYANFKKTNDFERLRTDLKTLNNLNAIITIPVLLLIVFFYVDVLAFLNLENTTGNRLVLFALAAAQIVNGLTGSTGQALQMIGYERSLARYYSATLVVYFLILLWLTSSLGFVGLVMAYSIATVLKNMISVFLIWSKVKLIGIAFVR